MQHQSKWRRRMGGLPGRAWLRAFSNLPLLLSIECFETLLIVFL